MSDWEIKKKISRMALGWDNYELVKGKAEPIPSIPEATGVSQEYVDSLEDFHKDVMEFFHNLNVYSNSDRLEQAERLVNLMKQGEAIRDLYSDN